MRGSSRARCRFRWAWRIVARARPGPGQGQGQGPKQGHLGQEGLDQELQQEELEQELQHEKFEREQLEQGVNVESSKNSSDEGAKSNNFLNISLVTTNMLSFVPNFIRHKSNAKVTSLTIF